MKNRLLLFCIVLSGCGGSAREYLMGQTLVVLEEGAEPWDDFPDVVWHLQHDEGLPDDLWDTVIYFYPAGTPLPFCGDAYGSPVCCYDGYGNIHIRPTRESTYQGCFAHELAHRWVDLLGGEKNCNKEIHECPRFVSRHRMLRKKVCPVSWAKTDTPLCPEDEQF